MKYRGGSSFSLKTGCLVIVVLGIVVYAALTLVQCAQDSKNEPPDAQTSPYLVATSSRIYLAQSGVIMSESGITRNFDTITGTYQLSKGETIIMTNWYDQNSDQKWKYHKGDSPTQSPGAYGEVSITKRNTKGEKK